MAGRAWNVFAYIWFIVFIWNGTTKADGVGSGDLLLAAAPWWIGKIAACVARYVVSGSVLAPRPKA